jgi:hypothetical protein
MLHCQRCGRPALLVLGQCADCLPDAHRRHEEALEAVGRADAAFRARTGRSALEDWQGFERFLEERG